MAPFSGSGSYLSSDSYLVQYPFWKTNSTGAVITTAGGLRGNNFSTVIIDEMCYLPKANKKDMKLSALMKRILDKDTKTLIKAGFLDKNLELTKKGSDALEAILVEQNKEALVKLADVAIFEEEEEDLE
jgi:hypothetical protein